MMLLVRRAWDTLSQTTHAPRGRGVREEACTGCVARSHSGSCAHVLMGSFPPPPRAVRYAEQQVGALASFFPTV